MLIWSKATPMFNKGVDFRDLSVLLQNRFPSCKSAKIMTDPISGMSRGYGFVRFSDEQDQQRV